MSTELYLNNKLAETKPGGVIALTFQVNDIGEMRDRQCTYSNTIDVVATQANVEAIGSAIEVPAISDTLRKPVAVRLKQSGIEIIHDGFGIATISGMTIKINIFDGIIGIAELLGDKKMRDLQFNDPKWHLSSALASRNNNGGHVWAIIDWDSQLSQYERRYNVEQAHPCVFLHTVIDAIVSSVGWKVKGPFTDSDVYKKILIPLVTRKNVSNYFITHATMAAAQSNTFPNYMWINFANEISDPLQTMGYVSNGAMFNQVSTHVLLNLNVVTGNIWRYRAHAPGRYSFECQLNYINNGPAFKAGLMIQRQGDPLVHLQYQQIPAMSSSAVTFKVQNIQMQNGDDIIVLLFPSNCTITGGYFKCTDVQFTDGEDTRYGLPFPIAANLPDVTQRAFLKAIMQMFAIVPIVDTMKKELIFVLFKDIANNIGNAVDWSSKLVNVDDLEVNLHSNYAKTNWLRYKDDDHVPKEYGDAYFTIDDETLEDVKDAFTLPFAATEDVMKMDGLSVPVIHYNSTPRILLLDRKSVFDGDDIIWEDSTTSSQPGGPEPFCYFWIPGKSDNLKFSDNLISSYYNEWIQMLKNYMKLTCYMQLTAADIATLDYTRPVYLSMFGRYFYLNKISEWIDGRICKVELVRLY